MNQPVRFLVIRFSSIGDIVLCTPVLRAIEEQIDGEVEIHFLTKKSMEGILEHNPRIYKIHSIEKATGEVLEELQSIPFDYIVDLHRNVRSSMVKRKLKMLDFTFKKRNWEKWLLVNFGINKLAPGEHVVNRYLDVLKPFGIAADQKGLEYHLPHELENEVNTRGSYVALVLGATHEGKQLSAKQWKGLVKMTQFNFVLLGGSSEVTIAKEITEGNTNVENLAGETTLHESALLIKHAATVVTGDTGLMHIASAFNKPIISIWGCTSPALQMSPYMPNLKNIILEPLNHPKRPCSKLGNKCKYGKGETRCITSIEPERIQEALLKIQ